MSSERMQIKQEMEEMDLTTNSGDLTAIERMVRGMQRRDEEAKRERQAIREEIGAMRQSMEDVWMAESVLDPATNHVDVKTENGAKPEAAEEDRRTAQYEVM